jgi:hypothetical protein
VPYYLPTPLPGELYADYIDRLAQRLWTGVATTVDDTSAYPAGSPAAQLAPGSVTALTTAGTTVALYSPTTGQPIAWPASAAVPQIATATQPVTVQKTPASSTGTGFPPLDFSAFTGGGGFTSSCNFPFGVLCWITGSVSAMNTPPQAPRLNWVLPDVNMGPLGTMTMGQHYDVNLANDSMDTYMGWIRTIISWVLWLGVIWYVGSRLLGLKGGGDPTDAIDEAYGGFVE